MGRMSRGTPLHRIAVLYPMAQPYALLAHEQFDAAEVPHNGPAVRRLAQTISGRTLLGLLRLHESDFRRDIVMDWLSAAPVLEKADGRPLPAHRWDVISRAAGVVHGEAQWRARLERYRRTLSDEHEYVKERDDAAGRLARLESDIDHVDRMIAFVAELARDSQARSQATWHEFASWARALLTRYLGGEGRREDWPDEEIEAHRAIEDALDELAGLDDVNASTSAAVFRRALEQELQRPSKRIGRFGTGVFIGRLADATGTDFDLAILLGMADGVLPPRQRDDPLLPDRERSDDMPLRARRHAEQRRSYLAALACAPERVLVFPRADLRGQRGRLPAPWLLESASRLEGRQVFSADLANMASTGWMTVVPSFESALHDGHEPASPQEYDLRSLLRFPRSSPITEHYLGDELPALRNGLLAGRERQSGKLSRWDGLVGPNEHLTLSADRAVSPTALQDWASCPFRYLLGRVLYVAETSSPEDTLSISAIERGNLVHKALERFVAEMPARAHPGVPWSDEERARLLAIGNELCADAEGAGLTGKRILWRLARDAIIGDLEGFLDADEAFRLEHGVMPAGVEVSFGLHGEAPLIIPLEDGAMAFRGRIDRVDRSPDGTRIVVVDYKSGAVRRSHEKLPGDPVHRGQLLQLPIYALAAQARHGAKSADAFYWFVTKSAEYKQHGYELTDQRKARFQDVLGVISRGIGGGVFPARPGPSSDNCMFCPYDRACAQDRERAWQRKRGAGELIEYVELCEGEE
jgi:RecB family exonuclease